MFNTRIFQIFFYFCGQRRQPCEIQLHNLEPRSTRRHESPALNILFTQIVATTLGFAILFTSLHVLRKKRIRPRGFLDKSYLKRMMNMDRSMCQ